MWKTMSYNINSIYMKVYSDLQKDCAKKISSLLKDKPINKCLHIRYQSTDSSRTTPKFSSFTATKQPPPSYLRHIKPPPKQQNKNITAGSLLLLAVPLGTFALGTWQVQRRNWKLNLIEELKKKTEEPPIDFPDDLSELSSLEYRRVKIKGKFDHSIELYLGPRSLIKNGEGANKGGYVNTKLTGGHLVITPFILSKTGQRILVNRGWVPSGLIQPSKRLEGQIEDEVEIIGLVRLQEARGTFVPENKPHLNVFHYRDLKKMAKKTNTIPVLLDATEESTVPGGPIGGQTVVTLRNEHMSYIVTWYSLSAITLVLWLKKFVF